MTGLSVLFNLNTDEACYVYGNMDSYRRMNEQGIQDRYTPGIAAEQIKDRLVYLRGYYSKELGKHAKSKKNSSGSDDVYNSGWKYFKKYDSFLKSQIIPRASKTNMDSTSQHNQGEETDNEFDSYCRLSGENWETRSTAASSSSTPSVPSKKRKHKVGTESMVSEPDSFTSDTSARFKEFSNEKDVPAQKSDSELFGEYVTRELDNIADERSRITLKYKIQTLFYEMQLGLHSQTEKNRTAPTEPSLCGSILISNLTTPLGFGHIMQSVAPQMNTVTSNFRENNRPTELYQTPQINNVASNLRENNGLNGHYQTPQINTVASNLRENNGLNGHYQTPQINTVASNLRENNGLNGHYQTPQINTVASNLRENNGLNGHYQTPQINTVASNLRENNGLNGHYQTPQINTVASNLRENNGLNGHNQTPSQLEETQNAEVKTESYLTLI